MSRAQQRGSALRRQLGLRGQVDAEAAANDFGLTVDRWPFLVLKEMCIDDHVAVAERLTPEWRRWVVAYAVAHRLLHPSNHVWIHRHINLARGFEREAEDFAYGLLVGRQPGGHVRETQEDAGSWQRTSACPTRWCGGGCCWEGREGVALPTVLPPARSPLGAQPSAMQDCRRAAGKAAP